MNSTIHIAVLTAWLGVAAVGSAQPSDDVPGVQAIVDRASAAAYYQGKDGRASASLTITDGQGRERLREFTILRTDIDDIDNGEQRFYILFSRPSDVNRTAFMVWKHVERDDDRWLYLPALDLVKRITAGDERTSFVGSHFFYEDVSGRGPTEDVHELIDTTDEFYVVDSTPRDPSAVAFSRYRNYIHKETFVPVRADYYDANDEIYRVYTALAVETIEGHPTVVESSMADRRSGGTTTLRFTNIDYDLDLPEDVFTERSLRTPPRRHLR